uniref:winged helix-turn-helix transcriptional regulator n=1 Tax=Enterobacter bugandensis TaxID=881260 RepID=UPI003B5BD747
QMERDGLVIRTIHPVIPPKVEYRLTELGFTLAEAFCGVWPKLNSAGGTRRERELVSI